MDVPTPEIKEYGINAIGGCKPETAREWKKLMEDAGLVSHLKVVMYY